jgi:hypothetical protein
MTQRSPRFGKIDAETKTGVPARERSKRVNARVAKTQLPVVTVEALLAVSREISAGN